jgi:hypothetical protein
MRVVKTVILVIVMNVVLMAAIIATGHLVSYLIGGF